MYATVASFPGLPSITANVLAVIEGRPGNEAISCCHSLVPSPRLRNCRPCHAGVEEFCSMEEWLVDCKNHGRQTLRTKATGVMNGCYTWRTYV